MHTSLLLKGKFLFNSNLILTLFSHTSLVNEHHVTWKWQSIVYVEKNWCSIRKRLKVLPLQGPTLYLSIVPPVDLACDNKALIGFRMGRHFHTCTLYQRRVADSPRLLPRQPQMAGTSAQLKSAAGEEFTPPGQVQINCCCALHNAAVLGVFFSFLTCAQHQGFAELPHTLTAQREETPTQGRATMSALAGPQKTCGEPLKNNTAR